MSGIAHSRVRIVEVSELAEFYSKQTFYCCACGKKIEAAYARLIGREWKVCSPECNQEMHLRRAKSIMGEA